MVHTSFWYADDVNMLGGSAHTVKKNAEALLVETKDIGLEVNADKTKCIIMSCKKNAGKIQTKNTGKEFFERAENLKYLKKP